MNWILCFTIVLALCYAANVAAFSIKEHAHNTDDIVGGSIMHITEKSKQRGSSSREERNQSESRMISENKRWTHDRLNTPHGKKLLIDTHASTDESGGNSQSELSRRESARSDKSSKTLLINGNEVKASETGSSSRTGESMESSSVTNFQKSLEVEKRKQILQQKLDLRCIEQSRITIYIIVHLNRNWRQKLLFVRKLLNDVYDPNRVDIFCVMFNTKVRTFSSFGPLGLKTKAALLQELSNYEQIMDIQESQQTTQSWYGFELAEALGQCFSYAIMHKNSRAQNHKSIMLSYFDSLDELSSATVTSARQMVSMPLWNSLFSGSLCVLQGQQSVTSNWMDLASALSTSQNYILPAQESLTLDFMSKMVAKLCQAVYTRK